jgi:hypothetical protein
MRTYSWKFIPAVLLAAVSSSGPANGAPAGPHWEAVTAQVTAGKAVHLDVRLVGADGKPMAGTVMVTWTRLDMGPDNMQMMTAPVHQVASTQAGVTSFEADLSSTGRWALTIAAKVTGQAQPVSGQVVFTAVKPR